MRQIGWGDNRGLRWLGLALAVVCLLVLPSVALGQSPASNPFSPGLPQGQSPTSTTPTTPALPVTPTTSTAGGNGLSGGGVIAIAIGALVILGGISAFIWRDARRRAPVRTRTAGPDVSGGGRPGSKSKAKPRKLSPAERRRRKRGRAR